FGEFVSPIQKIADCRLQIADLHTNVLSNLQSAICNLQFQLKEAQAIDKVLLTGGAGYIGALLAPMLLEEGYEVTILDNFLYGAQPVLGFSMHPKLTLIKGDVRDQPTINKLIAKHDWILHLAAIVGYPACAADPFRASTTNVEGTRNIVQAMSKTQRLI